MKTRTFLASVMAAMTLSAPSALSEQCPVVAGITSICGLQAPEDIVAVPDSPYLLFSQFVPGGGLGLLDTRDDSVAIVKTAGSESIEPGWGSPDCPGADVAPLQLHGIDLRQRGDGRWQVLAVGHEGRESVEFFELIPADNALPELVWRGCVPAPEEAFFNDVVALADGGFLVTHMFPRSGQTWGAIKSILGFDTGFVYRWSPDMGFIQVPGTDAPMPNGIALAPDERHFYLNAWSGSEVRKYALAGGLPLAVAPMQNPDNSSWDSDGRLLVASHRYRWSTLLSGIPNADGSPIMLRFTIEAVDPETMVSTMLFEHEGAPMGGGTTAVLADDHLYIGSYTGDRMIKAPLEGRP